MISTDDFCWFVDDALDKMTVILRQLGDELSNRRPELPGANSPYAIVTHCLGVMNMWGGYRIAGREVDRDRDAEFQASGNVDDLVAKIEVSRQQLRADIAHSEMSAELRNPANPDDADQPFAKTQGAALIHVYEELAQHLGHLELSRDVLLAAQ